MIEIGDPAPDFNLHDQDGRAHCLGDYAGAPLVLYFYPKDDTKGCTDEACQFRDALPRFRKADVAVLGVSPDDLASHAAFAAKHKLSFPILSNPTQDVLQAYGVWQTKSMFGRPYMGVVRTTYLIDAHGRVVRRWDNVEVPGHADEVFEAVRDHLAALAPDAESKPLRRVPTKPSKPKKRSPRDH
ncbi:MAG: peroxiredoxin [Phycisphaerales bacterium]|nr:peroxiredoxin [Phycisphaerales bacterium]